MKRSLLIVFPSEHLAYSPTTINLYDILSETFEVTILAPTPRHTPTLQNRRVKYVSPPRWTSRVAESLNFRLNKYLGWNPQLGRLLLAMWLWWAARGERPEVAVGVDFLGMWVVQRACGCGQMVSLELDDDDLFLNWVNFSRVESLVIQTQARYDRFFGHTGVRCFLVQNAPVYRRPPHSELPAATSTNLLYCGTATPGFGIYRCLDFLVRYPEFRLTIQGSVVPDVRRKMESHFADLLAAGRIVINQAYLEGSALTDYMSRFALGICCYDFSVPEINNFNYLSAPSGKLFTYYVAGVPVIGSDIPGLTSVQEFEAGILIPEFTPEAMHSAVATILSERERMSANCLRAAQHYSFDKAVAPWVRFLTQQPVIRSSGRPASPLSTACPP